MEDQKQFEYDQSDEKQKVVNLYRATEQEALYCNNFQVMQMGDDFTRIVFSEQVHPSVPTHNRTAVILPNVMAEGLGKALADYYEKLALSKAKLNATVQ